MKKMASSLLIIFAAVCVTSCIPAATDAEMGAMCENLTKLRGDGDLSSEADLLKAIEVDFAAKLKKLEDWRAKDLAGWDKELAAKLEAAEADEDKTDEDKAKLKEEYAGKKDVTSKQFDPDIEKLGPAKVEAVKAAKQKVIDDKAAYDTEIAKCVKEAKAEGVNQSVATCRAGAESTDKYWNFCR